MVKKPWKQHTRQFEFGSERIPRSGLWGKRANDVTIKKIERVSWEIRS